MSGGASTERRDRASKYLLAAELLDAGAKQPWNTVSVDYACHALAMAERPLGREYMEANHLCEPMRELFSNEIDRHAWLLGIGDFIDNEERKGRVLALCFMAAMVEAGDA